MVLCGILSRRGKYSVKECLTSLEFFGIIHLCFADYYLKSSEKSVLCVFPRAPGELDGHARDPAGGHGVPAEVPWRHVGRAAERRGAVSRCSQENCCYGEVPMEITPDLTKKKERKRKSSHFFIILISELLAHLAINMW